MIYERYHKQCDEIGVFGDKWLFSRGKGDGSIGEGHPPVGYDLHEGDATRRGPVVTSALGALAEQGGRIISDFDVTLYAAECAAIGT